MNRYLKFGPCLIIVCLWGNSCSPPPVKKEPKSEEKKELEFPVLAGPQNNYMPRPLTPLPRVSHFASNSQELEMGRLIENYAQQRRLGMRRNAILSEVARQRAEDMARRSYFNHTNPDGIGPNHLIRQKGYVLPGFYDSSLAGNNVESIAAGDATAAGTFKQWLNSAGHRSHVLGETPFYRDQVDYGVGFAQSPTSPFRYYWVFLSAKN